MAAVYIAALDFGLYAEGSRRKLMLMSFYVCLFVCLFVLVTFVGLRSPSVEEMDISPVVPKVDFLLIGKLNYLPGAVYPPFLQHMTLVYNAVICHVMFLYV